MLPLFDLWVPNILIKQIPYTFHAKYSKRNIVYAKYLKSVHFLCLFSFLTQFLTGGFSLKSE